jgi:hypothetical protein
MALSFYNLDYIIEINQKRLEEYNASLQLVLGRLTNIILIYSGLGIFLVTFIQHAIDGDLGTISFYFVFSVFAILLILSLYYFIRLLLPEEIAYLDPPEKYYKDYMAQMELDYPGQQDVVDKALKGSYILELEDSISTNYQVFRRKSSFYYNALLFALLAVIPYITCLGYHLSKKDDKIQKVEIVAKKA